MNRPKESGAACSARLSADAGMDSTLSQGYAAAAFLYAGIVLGVCYDVARVLRLLAEKRLVTHLTDALFVAVFGIVGYAVFHVASYGVIRPYGLALLGLGAAVQQWAFGRPICKRIVKRRK